MSSEGNSFDLLWLMAAFMVLFSHNYPLSGLNEITFLHFIKRFFVKYYYG